MSLEHGSSIVRDNLVICLDAANQKSYPGTGTTWKDLSGNNKHGTIGGATFNENRFTFDGVNDYISFGTGNTVFPLPQISLEFVFRSFGTVPTTGVYPSLTGLTYGVFLRINSTSITAYFDNGTGLATVTSTETRNFYDSNWTHVIVTHTGALLSLYVNGKFSNQTAGTWLGTTRWPTNSFALGQDNNNVNTRFYGDIQVFRLYSKALTSEEVYKNFESIRGRYGL